MSPPTPEEAETARAIIPPNPKCDQIRRGPILGKTGAHGKPRKAQQKEEGGICSSPPGPYIASHLGIDIEFISVPLGLRRRRSLTGGPRG